MIWLIILVVIFILIGTSMWVWPLIAGVIGLSNVSDKPSALKHITQLMNTYDITQEEVATALHDHPADNAANTQRSKGDIAKTLFTYLGAIFILAGISTYIGMFWESMGSVMRISVTLGVGYVLLVVLLSALYEKKYPKLILPLALAYVFMTTGGWFVLIHELFPSSDNWRTAVLFVFGVMALQLGLLMLKYQLTVLVFATLFFVYGFLEVGLDLLGLSIPHIAVVLGASLFIVATAINKTPHRLLAEPALLIAICWLNSGLFDLVASNTAPNWASLVIGSSIMLSAYGIQKAQQYPRLSGLGYLIGSIMAYSGLFDLVQHTPFEIIYLAVTAAILYACVILQSRALLLTTVIAMLSFIGYFSAEHFANSLGWPVTLVLMGIAFLAVGTVAIRVKQRI